LFGQVLDAHALKHFEQLGGRDFTAVIVVHPLEQLFDLHLFVSQRPVNFVKNVLHLPHRLF
jgi:hypothetical protein